MTPSTPATATPTPIATATANTSNVTAGSTAQSVTLAGTGVVGSAAVTVPAASGAGGTIVVGLSATAPSGTAAVASTLRKAPTAIGGALTPLAYITVTPSASIAFASTLSFSFTLASGQTIPGGAAAYVGVYDPTNTMAGWTTYDAAGTVTGQTVTFAPLAQGVTLKANVAYVFAFFATVQALSPQTAATTFPGGASLVPSFSGSLPAAARSIVFTFTPSGGNASTALAAVPNGCTVTACAATVGAPVGTSQSVQAQFYASANGSGPALAVATTTASFFTGQATSAVLAARGIVSSFTVSASPAAVSAGFSSNFNIAENEFDAASEPITSVNVTFVAPVFTITSSDTSGAFTTTAFSGVAPAAPVTFTVTSPGYAAATSAPISVASPAPATIGYAYGVYDPSAPEFNATSVQEYAGASATVVRSYAPVCSTCTSHPRFDPSGTLWGFYAVGITSAATSAGTFAPTGKLLAFDYSGHAYVADPSGNAVDEVTSATNATLIRQIILQNPPSSAAVDETGNLYVTTINAGTVEYPPSGTGTLSPIATNATVSLTAIDGFGNVYGLISGGTSTATIGVWPAGTFGSGLPPRTITLTPTSPPINGGYYITLDMGVDAAGDVYLAEGSTFGISTTNKTYGLFYAPAGTSTFPQTPLNATTLNLNYDENPAFIAVPLR